MDRVGGSAGADPSMDLGDDSNVVVTVFRDVPGGYLPVGEFATLHAELAAAQERVGRLSDMAAISRVLWLSAGFVTGLLCGVMLHA